MENQDLQPNITIQSLDSMPVSQAVAPQGYAPAPVAVASAPVSADVSEKVSYQDASIQEVDITTIAPNPYQPRKVFEIHALQELADSIKEHGVIQPLVVTKTPVGNELVVGERRFRAAQLGGLEKVPAIIKDEIGRAHV